ncbi:hypothetical protein HYV43_04805 [Candidatus Micrarchaeota archaeon]|nr:hypothetical protein [Candidatus Micrarchaeota archaeon]
MSSKRLFFVSVLLAAALGVVLGGGSSLRLVSLPDLAFDHDYAVHWHAHLSIVDGSDELVVPADVGLYFDRPASAVHTHDDSGLLHVEAESVESLPPHTLAYFFSVWNQTFSSACVADVCTDSTRQLRFFVNGQERLDWRMYDLADGDEIEFVLDDVAGFWA